MRICSKCKFPKDESEFTIAKKRANKIYYGYSKDCHKLHNLKDTEKLSDKYIMDRLKSEGFSKQDLKENPEIIEIKRQSIKLKRLIWQIEKH